jgi:lipooligosaccharide transport system permease protein
MQRIASIERTVSLVGVARVWRRFAMTLTSHLVGFFVNDFLTPILQVLAYGYGVGALVGSLTLRGLDVSYLAFIVCGLYASRSLWQGFFRGSYGAYMRMVYERLYNLIPSSPITLEELVIGEIAWGATMSAISGLGILAVGIASGTLLWAGLPFAIAAAFLGGWIFTALGLVCSSLAKDMHQLEYPFNLLIMPLSLFSGVYFPLELMPSWSQAVAQLLPLTSVVAMCQSALLGVPFDAWHLAVGAGWAVALTGSALALVRRKLQS